MRPESSARSIGWRDGTAAGVVGDAAAAVGEGAADVEGAGDGPTRARLPAPDTEEPDHAESRKLAKSPPSECAHHQYTAGGVPVPMLRRVSPDRDSG